MFIKHPIDKTLINLTRYADIRACPINPTHLDFYVEPQKLGERGKPDLTIEMKTEQERDTLFSAIEKKIAK